MTEVLSKPREHNPIGFDMALQSARSAVGEINKNLRMATKLVPKDVLVKFLQDAAIAIDNSSAKEGSLVGYFGPHGDKLYPDSRFPDELFLGAERLKKFYMKHPRLIDGPVAILETDGTTTLVVRINPLGKLQPKSSAFWISNEHVRA